MAPVAGLNVSVKVSGTAVAFTGAATSNVSGNIYRLDDAAKRILDPSAAITVKDGGVAVAAANYTVDYLFGTVTLSAPPGGAVTVDGSYLPVHTAADAREFQVSMSREELEKTVFGDTVRKYDLGLKSAEGSVGGLDLGDTDLDSGGDTLKVSDVLGNGTPVLVEAYLGSSNKYWRGWVLFSGLDLSSAFEGLAESTIKFRASARQASGRSELVGFGLGTSP